MLSRKEGILNKNTGRPNCQTISLTIVVPISAPTMLYSITLTPFDLSTGIYATYTIGRLKLLFLLSPSAAKTPPPASTSLSHHWRLQLQAMDWPSLIQTTDELLSSCFPFGLSAFQSVIVSS